LTIAEYLRNITRKAMGGSASNIKEPDEDVQEKPQSFC